MAAYEVANAPRWWPSTSKARRRRRSPRQARPRPAEAEDHQDHLPGSSSDDHGRCIPRGLRLQLVVQGRTVGASSRSRSHHRAQHHDAARKRMGSHPGQVPRRPHAAADGGRERDARDSRQQTGCAGETRVVGSLVFLAAISRPRRRFAGSYQVDACAGRSHVNNSWLAFNNNMTYLETSSKCGDP